jgi:hypothetical protein
MYFVVLAAPASGRGENENLVMLKKARAGELRTRDVTYLY